MINFFIMIWNQFLDYLRELKLRRFDDMQLFAAFDLIDCAIQKNNMDDDLKKKSIRARTLRRARLLLAKEMNRRGLLN